MFSEHFVANRSICDLALSNNLSTNVRTYILQSNIWRWRSIHTDVKKQQERRRENVKNGYTIETHEQTKQIKTQTPTQWNKQMCTSTRCDDDDDVEKSFLKYHLQADEKAIRRPDQRGRHVTNRQTGHIQQHELSKAKKLRFLSPMHTTERGEGSHDRTGVQPETGQNRRH